ncbi:hypothetical protein B0H13DRAFT_2312556 [Mycena leptocephala]|nr:hypothetical protein B0H13DRAFT_2312556 [Mycena leptocephala]
MRKRKSVFVADDDLNDGSDSDLSQEGYMPREREERIHYIPDETFRVGADGRVRTTFSTIPTPASSAKKSTTTLNTDGTPNPEPAKQNWETEFSEFDAEYGPGIQSGPRTSRESDDPHGQWARLHREEFLDKTVRHDGRGDYLDQRMCAGTGCSAADPSYQCLNCLHPCLYCEGCVRGIHERIPFHRLERWNGRSFQRCSPKEEVLFLVLYLFNASPPREGVSLLTLHGASGRGGVGVTAESAGTDFPLGNRISRLPKLRMTGWRFMKGVPMIPSYGI